MNERGKYKELRPILFFDGYCNLCSGAVQFILKYERSEHYYFSSLQSGFARKFFNDWPGREQSDSVILYENGNIFSHSDAALRICRNLVFPFRMAYYFIYIPKFLRDPVYRFIARNRFRFFGRRETCYVAHENQKIRFLE